jgi:hypothetical protein
MVVASPYHASGLREDSFPRLHGCLRSSWVIPMLGHQAYGSGMCPNNFLRESPATQLLAENHSKQAKQSDNRRGRALYANQSV